MLTLSLYFRTAFGRAYWMSQRHSNSMCPNQATIFPLKPTLHLIPLEHEWQQYLSNTLDVCFHLLNSSSKLSQMCLHLSISIYTRLAQVTIIFIMKLLINPSWRHLSFSNLFTLQWNSPPLPFLIYKFLKDIVLYKAISSFTLLLG